MTEGEKKHIINVMFTFKDYPSVAFSDRSRLSARSVLLTSSKVSTGHPHPLTSGALLNITKYVGDDAHIVPVICIVGFSSFVCRKIAASLHLMREVAKVVDF